MKILLFLPDLEAGGTQRQFLLLSRNLAALGANVHLATLFPGGAMAGEIAHGVEHWSLFDHKGTRWRRPLQLARSPSLLRGLANRLGADVVYSALYVANAIAQMGRIDRAPLAWGIRGSRQELSPIRQLAFAYGRRHSSKVPLTIYNSSAGESFHRHQGFRCPQAVVIPNGFDTKRFCKDPLAGGGFRRSLGIPPSAFVVGIVGRLVPVKDHACFVDSAALVEREVPGSIFVCVGEGAPPTVRQLCGRARDLGLGGRLILTGARSDMTAAYNALDVLASTSLGEGFPNAVGEAMSCETPCVATAVGDTARLLGPTGTLVVPRDPSAQAAAWISLARMTPERRAELGRAARRRIEEHFGFAAQAEETLRVLSNLVASTSSARS